MNFLLASHRLCTMMGFEVRIAYSLYMIMGIFVLSVVGEGHVWEAVGILMLPLWVLLHELGHSVAARWFGVRVDGITLHMLGGMARMSTPIPGARAELVIAAAGPAVSLFLCATGFLSLLFLFPALDIRSLPLWTLTGYLFWINLMLGVFNLLPVFPMDGGRIALALAIMRCGITKGLQLIKPLSAVGAGLIALYGVYEMTQGQTSGLFLVMIGAMLFFQGGQELQARLYAQSYTNNMAAYSEVNTRGQSGWHGAEGSWQSGYQSRFNPDAAVREVYAREVPAHSQKEGSDRGNFIGRWFRRRKNAKQKREQEVRAELNRRVDEVLAKVKAEGITALTPGERALLQKASSDYRKS